MCINNDYIEDYDNSKKDNNSNDFIKQYNSNNNNINNWTINALKRYHTQCALCVCNESYAQYLRHTDLTVALPLSCSLSLFVSLAHLSSIAFNWAQFVDFYCTCCDQLLPQCAPKIYGQLKRQSCLFVLRTIVKKRAVWPSSIRSSTNLSISGGRFLKLVIMRKSNTLAHTRTHSQKVNRVCKQLTRFFFYLFFFVSELSICKCICWCCCCVCQCICICCSLISLFALN